MRFRQELLGSERQVWCYMGRRDVHGVDCYVWSRFLSAPDSAGYQTHTRAIEVARFWPGGER